MTGNAPGLGKKTTAGIPRLQRLRTSRAGIGPLLVLPALLLLIVFVYRPLFRSIQLSFFGSDLIGNPTRFIGIDQWTEFFADPGLRHSVAVSLLIATLAMVMSVSLALGCALLLRRRLPGGRIFQIIFSLPFAYSAASASVVFLGLFGPGIGMINLLLQRINLEGAPWLQSPGWAIFTIAVTTAWYESGFCFLVMFAAVKSIPPEVIEASELDGASGFTLIRSILIPMMWPSLFFLFVTQMIVGLQTFTQIYIMTRGGPQDATFTLVYRLYNLAFGQGTADFGRASVIAVFLVLIVAAVTLLQFRISRRMNS